MKGYLKASIVAFCAIVASSAQARSGIEGASPTSAETSGNAQISGALECVPYARQLSGIQLYGDAHTWWKQAKGRYQRGNAPRVGAVMAIKPHGNSLLGHVAMVSKIVDTRTVLLSHANWSYPGKIEKNVAALDVSPNNDWSEVRIWYGPSRNLGVSHWPVAGFIYNAKPGAFQDDSPARITRASARRHSDPIGAIISGTY